MVWVSRTMVHKVRTGSVYAWFSLFFSSLSSFLCCVLPPWVFPLSGQYHHAASDNQWRVNTSQTPASLCSHWFSYHLPRPFSPLSVSLLVFFVTPALAWICESPKIRNSELNLRSRVLDRSPPNVVDLCLQKCLFNLQNELNKCKKQQKRNRNNVILSN